MRLRWLRIAILLAIAAVLILIIRLRKSGLSARSSPPAIEALAANEIRRWAVPADARNLANPIASSTDSIERGRSHWADHCATCHANNGNGDTEMGRNLYPRAPDMRSAETQSLTDGELYYIIRNGVPMTGMPAWGDARLGNADAETWMLVAFIRHLPHISADEEAAMEKLNPKSAMDRQEEQQEEDFLNGKTNPEKKHDH
jgi:mono/diheme cytochrome c family protein